MAAPARAHSDDQFRHQQERCFLGSQIICCIALSLALVAAIFVVKEIKFKVTK
jgi:hypothetical protein